MSTIDSTRIAALFSAVVELDPIEREAHLARECADEPALADEIRRLLAADARLVDMTARPIAADLGRAIAARGPALSLTGQRLGPWELREELGRGGMGLVYRAERVDGTVKQQVAVKFMRRELFDESSIRRFHLERELLASLDHPGIARLIDAAELEDGSPYYVMEYVAGEPITDYCHRERLGVRERIALLRRVCDAVAEAHHELIVHRDLKPGNILITADGAPKLLDFGIAKPLNAVVDEQTGTAQRYFSPYYAAPEQLTGAPVGVACDVYALGLLAYELLAGARPFDFTFQPAAQVERLITQVPPPAPSVTRAKREGDFPVTSRQLQGDLDGIVLRCLRKAPGERYHSVERLAADLANYLEGRPVEARGGHAAYRLRKFVGRHRVAVAGTAAVALALAVAGAALVRQNERLTQERDRAEYAVRFMKDAFTAADPGQGLGADVSARQILEATRPKLDEIFVARPDLFASLAGTIADVELAMGMLPQALELAQRANAAARRAGSDADLRRHLLVTEAKLVSNLGNRKQGFVLLEEAAQLPAKDRTEWELHYGRLLCDEARFEECLAILEKAATRVRDRPPTDDLATVARRHLADAYRANGDLQRALDVNNETIRWQSAALPPQHPRIMRTRLQRIEMLGRSERHAEAVAEADVVIAALGKVYGTTNTLPLVARDARGISLIGLGRHEEAAADFRFAIAEYERLLGPEHPKVINEKVNLAEALRALPAHVGEADETYRFALAATLRRYGARNEYSLYVRIMYLDFLFGQERYDEALAALTEPAGLESYRNTKYEPNREDYLAKLKVAHERLCTGAGPSDVCGIAKDAIEESVAQKVQ